VRRYLLALMLSIAAGSSAAGSAHADSLQRLVSVNGSVTEVVYALGAQGQLVGVDTTSKYPPETQKLPNVGYQRQLSAEGVLSLQPSLVLVTEDAGPPTALCPSRQRRC
jgi:iron complex transport system substrate-binding protein